MGNGIFLMATSGGDRLDLPINSTNIPSLLRHHAIKLAKGLGQNFLIDQSALERIVAAADVTFSDIVLEVGAGLGNLTVLLAKHAHKVIAVELDRRFIPILQTALAGYENVQIIQGDILELDILSLLSGVHTPREPERGRRSEPLERGGPAEGDTGLIIRSPDSARWSIEPRYLIVANIPYYITSALIRHLLEALVRPKHMVITVQREVAERICASPGQPRQKSTIGEMSLLALSVQVFGRPEIAFTIPSGAFYPRPKVDSAVVRIDVFQQPAIPAELLDVFFKLAKAGFGQKRKMLRNALSHGLGLDSQRVMEILIKAGIDPKRRAETLSLTEWKELTMVFSNYEWIAPGQE